MVKRLADEFSKTAGGHPLDDVIDASCEMLLNAILHRSRDIEQAIDNVEIICDRIVLEIVNNPEIAKQIMALMPCTAVVAFRDTRH